MNILIGFIIFIIGMFIGIAVMCMLQISRENEEIERVMVDVKVKKWVSYELASQEIEIGELKVNDIGGLGGWFEKGHRWNDYITKFKKRQRPYIESLRKEIINNNIKFAGSEHQERKDGVPVFSDGTVALYSYRAWGDLMAAIWSTEENRDYSYIDFYMRITLED